MDHELAVIAAALRVGGSASTDAIRARMQDVLARAAVTVPDDGRVDVDDRDVPGPPGAPAVRVRVYKPAGGGGPRPGLLHLHGGGFVAGDLDTEHARCLTFADRARCVVVSVDYRLAPQHRFPAAVDDGYAALTWMAGDDGPPVDRERIGVGGSSAGAGLAAALALLARDRGAPRLAFQMLVAPVLDDRMATASMEFVGTPLFDGPAAARMWQQYVGSRDGDGGAGGISEYAAPARARDLRGLPEAYVMTSELDPLRDEGLEYAGRLLRAGVAVELHQYAGAFHGFEQLATEVSRRATDEQADWLRRITTR